MCAYRGTTAAAEGRAALDDALGVDALGLGVERPAVEVCGVDGSASQATASVAHPSTAIAVRAIALRPARSFTRASLAGRDSLGCAAVSAVGGAGRPLES
jgi:hypothetical protein